MPLADGTPGNRRAVNRGRAKASIQRQIAEAAKAVSRDYGPTPGRATITPSEAKARAAAKRFLRQRGGPIGQRTAGVYTPWQKRERRERREERERLERLAANVYAALLESPVPHRPTPVRAPQTTPAEVDGGQGIINRGLTLDRWRDLARQHPGGTGLTLTDIADALMGKLAGGLDALAPGGGDSSVREVLEDVVPTPGGSGTLHEVRRAGIDLTSELSQLPQRLVTQPIEAALMFPAAVEMAVSDPVGMGKAVAQGFVEDVTHPLENPGFLAMDLWGLGGLLRGGVRQAGAVREADPGGKVRAALRTPDTPAREVAPGVLETQPTGTAPVDLRFLNPANRGGRDVGRARRRFRQTEAELLAAPAAAMRREARAVTDTEGLAVRMQATQITPDQYIARWTEVLNDPTTSKYDQQRLRKALTAAHEVKGRGLVTVTEAGVRVAPELEQWLQRTRETVGDTEEVLIRSGALDRERAQARVDLPGAAIRGDDVVPGERLRMVTPEFPDEETFRPTLRTVESLERDLARAERALVRVDQRLATTRTDLSERAARGILTRIDKELGPLRESGRLDELLSSGKGGSLAMRAQELVRRETEIRDYLEGKAPGVSALGPAARLAATAERDFRGRQTGQLQERIGEAEQYLPQPERLPPGEFYVTGVAERHRMPSGLVPMMGGRVLGRQRSTVIGSASKRSEYFNELHARFDLNAPKATAERAVMLVKDRMRLLAAEQAVNDPRTMRPREFADYIDSRPEGIARGSELRHWRAVRVGDKTSVQAPATAQLLARMFGRDPLFSKPSTRDGGFTIDDLRELADAADAEDQVRFFDNRRVMMDDLVNINEGKIRMVADGITQAAKTMVLFTKVTGYVTPQVIGQVGMTLLNDVGITGALEFGPKMSWWWRQLTPHEREMLQAGRGSGIAESVDPARGPSERLRALNVWFARVYGLGIDSPFRNMSFARHASTKGYEGVGGLKKLLNAKEGTAEWRALHEIRDRVEMDYGAFRKLGPFEREIARYIFFYPWLRASTIWAAQLPRKHPAKTAVMIQAGREADRRTQQVMTDAFEALADLPPEQAEQVVDWFRDEYPGLYIVGTDKQGRRLVRAPQSLSVTQGPFDAVKAFRSIISGHPEELLKMSTPAVAVLGAIFNYDTFRGGSYPQGMTVEDRLASEVQGWVPGLTLSHRLAGDTGRLFDYTPSQAVQQYAFGSQSTRALNVPNVADTAERHLPKPSGREQVLETARKDRSTFLEAFRLLDDLQYPDVVRDAKAGKLPPDLRKALDFDTHRALWVDKAMAGLDDASADDRAQARLRATLEFLAYRKQLPDRSKIPAIIRQYATGHTYQQINGYIGSLIRRHGLGDVIDDYQEILTNNGIRIVDGELVVTNEPAETAAS